MDRRKRIMNLHEEATHAILQKVVSEYGAKTFPKIRIADVLEIDSSGLSNDEYSYALKAHFDFIVTNEQNIALFAVEFDGPHHESDTKAIANDAKKNAICRKFGLPILRVSSEFLTRQIRRFTLLSWLTELWFLEEAFYKGQENGEIPEDEPFMYFAIMADSVDDVRQGKLTFPYDLSLPTRVFVQKCCQQGRCKDFTPSVHFTAGFGEHTAAIAMIRITDEKIIVGQARCRSFQFSPISARELCQELAMIEAGEHLRKYLAGTYKPCTRQQADLLLNRLQKFASKEGTKVAHSGTIWNNPQSPDSTGVAAD